MSPFVKQPATKPRRRWLLRFLLGSTAAAVLTLGVGYLYFTNPARLRAELMEKLAHGPFRDLRVGQINWSFPASLILSDVAFEPIHSAARPGAPMSSDAPRFQIGEIHLHGRPDALFSGEFVLTRVDVRNAEVDLICHSGPSFESLRLASPGDSNWQQALGAWLAGASLPRMQIHDLDVRLSEAANPPRLVRRWRATAEGKANEGGYALRFEDQSNAEDPLLAISWDRDADRIEASCDWIQLRTLAELLDPRWAASVERSGLAGRVRIERLVVPVSASIGRAFAPSGAVAQSEFCVQFDQLTGELPLEQAVPPGGAHFFRFQNGELRVETQATDPSTMIVRGTAGLNDAQLRVALQASLPKLLDAAAPAPPSTLEARPGDRTDAFVTAIDSADVTIENIALPTVESAPALMKSPHFPQGLSTILQDYKARGRINASIRLQPQPVDRPQGDWAEQRLLVDVEPLRTTLCYHRFPYEFQNARGFVRYRDGDIQFDNLTATHGGGTIFANGTLTSAEGWCGFDLQIRGRNLALDADLHRALTPSNRRLWEAVWPLGICDVDVRLDRPEGSAEIGEYDTNVDVTTRLLAGSILLDNGRRLENAEGLIRVANDTVHILELHGYDGPAAMRLSGVVQRETETARAELHVEIADLPVERRSALGAVGSAGATDAMQFSGVADVSGRVSRELPQGADDSLLSVRLKRGKLTGFGGGAPWQVAEGILRIVGANEELQRFLAHQGEARFTVRGQLSSDRDDFQTSIQADATTPDLPATLRQLLPPQWHSLAEEFQLAGAGAIHLELTLPAVPVGAGMSEASARLALRAAAMQPKVCPLPVRSVEAALTFQNNAFNLERATAQYGERGRITLAGSGNTSTDGRWVELHGQAADVELCPALISAMPSKLRNLLERLEPSGRATLDLGKLRIDGAQFDWWRITGSLQIRGGSLPRSLDLREFDGMLTATASMDPRGDSEMQGNFTIDRGKLMDRSIERCEGEITQRPGDPWIRIDNLRSRLAGGELRGTFAFNLDTTAYQADLTFQEVRLNDLFPPANAEKPRAGRLNGHIYLSGLAGVDSSRRGGGEIAIIDGNFIQNPVLRNVAEIRGRSGEQVSQELERAEFKFIWDGTVLHATQIDISSRDLRLISAGDGTWDLSSDRVKFDLVGAHPRNLPRLAVLTDMIEQAGQGLVKYRVQGTMSDPRVAAEPLPELNDAVRSMLDGGRRK